MGQRIVQAVGLHLLPGHGLAAFNALGICLAEGQMAGSVFVKQGVVEQNLLIGNGAVIGDQSHFSEVAGALVYTDGGFQEFLTLFGVGFHDLAVPDDEVELVDDVATVHQRHGGIDHAVNAGFQRGGENFLRGHIGHEFHTVFHHGVAGGPEMVLRQLDGEVSAQRVGVVEILEVILVQQVLPAAQGIQMLTPGGNGGAVSLNADGAENGIPQLFRGLILRQFREYGGGPGGNGHRGDAPREAVAHLEPVKGLAEHGTGFLRPDQPVGVHALQRFRIAGGNGQIGGSHFRIAGEKLFAPLRRVIENGGVRPEELLPTKIVVTPVHDDLPAACVIGRVSTQPGEGGALHRR